MAAESNSEGWSDAIIRRLCELCCLQRKAVKGLAFGVPDSTPRIFRIKNILFLMLMDRRGVRNRVGDDEECLGVEIERGLDVCDG